MPPRPKLQCSACDFENEDPERLAKHLIETHNYGISQAWFTAGLEHERLYPRFRAPKGEFCVLGVDNAASTGAIIATCSNLEIAVAAADKASGYWPEITVQDDSGKELYRAPSKPAEEMTARNVMNAISKISSWQEGQVDRTQEHFELRYGSVEDDDRNSWPTVAVVGPPIDGIVNVQFLVNRGDPKNQEAVSKAKKEIQFYLIDKNERYPWKYARYHCGTCANFYSKIHWSFFDSGNQTQVQGQLFTGKALTSLQEVGSEDKKPTEKPTPQVEGQVPVRITTIPTHRPKKK